MSEFIEPLSFTVLQIVLSFDHVTLPPPRDADRTSTVHLRTLLMHIDKNKFGKILHRFPVATLQRFCGHRTYIHTLTYIHILLARTIYSKIITTLSAFFTDPNSFRPFLLPALIIAAFVLRQNLPILPIFQYIHNQAI